MANNGTKKDFRLDTKLSNTHKISLGTYLSTLLLVQVHRNLLHLLDMAKVQLNVRWSCTRDIKLQSWAAKMLTDTQTPSALFLIQILAVLEDQDPSLVLFWFFVGSVFCATSTNKSYRIGLATEFFWSYCHLMGRTLIANELKPIAQQYEVEHGKADDEDGYKRAVHLNFEAHVLFAAKGPNEPLFYHAGCNTDAANEILHKWNRIGFIENFQHCAHPEYLYAANGPLGKLERMLLNPNLYQIDRTRITLRVARNFTMASDEHSQLVHLGKTERATVQNKVENTVENKVENNKVENSVENNKVENSVENDKVENSVELKRRKLESRIDLQFLLNESISIDDPVWPVYQAMYKTLTECQNENAETQHQILCQFLHKLKECLAHIKNL